MIYVCNIGPVSPFFWPASVCKYFVQWTASPWSSTSSGALVYGCLVAGRGTSDSQKSHRKGPHWLKVAAQPHLTVDASIINPIISL